MPLPRVGLVVDRILETMHRRAKPDAFLQTAEELNDNPLAFPRRSIRMSGSRTFAPCHGIFRLAKEMR
jgi:hypothetical protein